MSKKALYAEIAKVSEQEDGTLVVEGFASSGAVDSDGETITPDAMKAALPDYMKFGALREMHQPSAAGTAIKAEVMDDGRTSFSALVVDPVAVKKVQAGVYKGFSIGGRVTERDKLDKSMIKGIKLIEVSLVDRPANPDAVMTCFKADRTVEDDVEDLAELLDAGTVAPGELLSMALAKVAGAPAAPVEEVKKGMYSVGQFAYLLNEVLWLCKDAQAEAQYEGDNSQVPAKIADWLSAGGEILKEMVAEELGEMNAGTGAETPDDVAFSAKLLDLAKAGKALSAANMKRVKAIHDATAAMGACQGPASDENGANGADKVAKLTALEHTAAAHADLIKSLTTDAGWNADGSPIDFVKTLTSQLDALKSERDTLAKERDQLSAGVQELLALPRPGKALLKAIGRGEDVGTTGSEAVTVEPIRKADGTVNETATAIKLIRNLGGTRVA